ncbi:hypothetical protein [Caldiplasma sukawensis]
MNKTILMAGLIGLLFILNVSPVSASQSSQHVVIYSTYGSSNEELYVPVNSSGQMVYPDWHIYLYGSGSFKLIVNGSIIESGYSTSSYKFSYVWNLPGGSYANATLIFGSISYSFNDVITGPLSNRIIESVSVSSYCPGQDQFLTVSPGTSGALMYTHWILNMQSSQNVSYSLYVNGQDLMNGYVYGSKTVDFNVSGSTATVTIGLGSKIYKFPNELIASVPIQKYYGPKPPSLAYTVAEYEMGIARAFVASFFSVLIGILSVRKWVIEREKREVRIL